MCVLDRAASIVSAYHCSSGVPDGLGDSTVVVTVVGPAVTGAPRSTGFCVAFRVRSAAVPVLWSASAVQ